MDIICQLFLLAIIYLETHHFTFFINPGPRAFFFIVVDIIFHNIFLIFGQTFIFHLISQILTNLFLFLVSLRCHYSLLFECAQYLLLFDIILQKVRNADHDVINLKDSLVTKVQNFMQRMND